MPDNSEHVNPSYAESPIIVMGFPNALAVIGLKKEVRAHMPLVRSSNEMSCYFGDGSKIILATSKKSVVMLDTISGKYTNLEDPRVKPDDEILFMQSFSTHVLLHTRTGDLFVYDFKDHDWQIMEGVKNFLVLKSGNLLITYNGRYEIYNKNFLLIFFKDVDFIGFLTMIEQFQSMFEIGKDQVAILSGCGNWHMIDAGTYEKHLQDPVKMPYINLIRYSNFFHCVHSNDGRFSFLANHDKIFVFDHKTFMLHHEIKAKEIVKAMFYIESEQVKEPILMVVYTTFAEVI